MKTKIELNKDEIKNILDFINMDENPILEETGMLPIREKLQAILKQEDCKVQNYLSNLKTQVSERELNKINDREYNDDHLSTEERKSVLDRMGISYTEENLDETFVREVLD